MSVYLTEEEKQAIKALLLGTPERELPLLSAMRKLLAALPAEGDGEVDFGAKVSERDFNRFKSFFPQYGATKWFINSALTSFLERVEQDPDIVHLVNRAVDDALIRVRERSN